MSILSHIPWFRRLPALNRGTVWLEQRMKGNPLWGANPDRLVSAVTAWDAGYIADLARIVAAYEMHDDVAKIGVRKRDAAVARCEHTVLVEEGFEDDPRAQRHKDILTRFWATVRVTSAFNRAERGGVRLLKKQMMSAQSIGWSCHNIVWDTRDPREIKAQFIHLPMWHFENTTGELRFKTLATDIYGVPMADGEWLVHTGDAIGPAVALACCTKRLSLQDWMLFSERAATPGLLGKTSAAPGTDAWNKMTEMLQNWGRAWTGLVDRDTDITHVNLNTGEPPMVRLVERMDRAIAALYRGADLSTISKGEGLGASLQGEESDMLEIDDCISLSESLHEQVDRFVIRYMTGDAEPLAYIWIEPVSKPNIEAEIAVDNHLMAAGVKLSKRDMLQRYGRAEANPDDPADAAVLQQPLNGPEAGFYAPLNGGRRLPNEGRPFKRALGAFKNARSDSDGQRGVFPSEGSEGRSRADLSGDGKGRELLAALARDMAPAADEIKRFLELLESGATDEAAKEKAAALMRSIPDMLPEDPEGAAVIADAMAEAYGEASGESHAEARRRGEGLANAIANATECRAKDPAHCPTHGTPREHHDKGFQDRYGNGNPETLAANPTMNIERGKAVMTRLARKQTGSEPHAMYRKGIGWICIDAGVPGNEKNEYKGGHGISHILAKHPGAEREVAETLLYGAMYRNVDTETGKPNERKITLIRGNNVAILSKSHDGRLLITDYDAKSDHEIEKLKVLGVYHARGEN